MIKSIIESEEENIKELTTKSSMASHEPGPACEISNEETKD